MFKRFTVDEDVSTQTAIKSSAIRAIKQTIEDQFPVAETYMDAMIPKKAVVLEGKGKDRLTFVVVDGEAMFFRQRDGPYFPLLRTLHKFPNMMPRIQVDTGAIKFVLGGANVMCPGINSPGGAMPVELPEGAPVAVYAQGKESAMAVGILRMSTADIKSKGKGVAIEVLHHLDDALWHTLRFD